MACEQNDKNGGISVRFQDDNRSSILFKKSEIVADDRCMRLGSELRSAGDWSYVSFHVASSDAIGYSTTSRTLTPHSFVAPGFVILVAICLNCQCL
jgi:hypothetical protein